MTHRYFVIENIVRLIIACLVALVLCGIILIVITYDLSLTRMKCSKTMNVNHYHSDRLRDTSLCLYKNFPCIILRNRKRILVKDEVGRLNSNRTKNIFDHTFFFFIYCMYVFKEYFGIGKNINALKYNCADSETMKFEIFFNESDHFNIFSSPPDLPFTRRHSSQKTKYGNTANVSLLSIQPCGSCFCRLVNGSQVLTFSGGAWCKTVGKYSKFFQNSKRKRSPPPLRVGSFRNIFFYCLESAFPSNCLTKNFTS